MLSNLTIPLWVLQAEPWVSELRLCPAALLVTLHSSGGLLRWCHPGRHLTLPKLVKITTPSAEVLFAHHDLLQAAAPSLAALRPCAAMGITAITALATLRKHCSIPQIHA